MRPHTATAAQLTDSDLDGIRALIEQRSAILFDSSRERFFSIRVREYMEEQGAATGTDLLRQLKQSGVEYEALLERLLTQETSFFRYPTFFEALEKKILPELQQKKAGDNPRTLRIWSAGCSTGVEPYSIAVRLCATNRQCAGAWDIEILATDISRRALQQAALGTYSRRSLQELSPALIESASSPARRHRDFKMKPANPEK